MNYLTHSPSDIIRHLLIDLSLGSDPDTGNGVWPVFSAGEPNTPDNVITVYTGAGFDHGRSQIDGELLGLSGFQVRVRGKDHATGWTRADSIQRTLAESVLRKVVHVSSSSYRIHAISKIGDVLEIGTDTPNSKRFLFTINAAAVIEQTV